MTTMKKLGLAIAGVIAALVVAMVVAYVNLSNLTKAIVEKQVPGLTFTELKVGWNDVLLTGAKYTSGAGKVLLETDAIDVQPSLLSVFTDTFRIASVQIDKPYVFVQRREDGEVILPLPGAAAPGARRLAPKDGAPEKASPVNVGRLQVAGGRGEFVDRSVGAPHAKFTIRDFRLDARDIRYPAVPGRIPVEMSFTLAGKRAGAVRETGWIDPVSQSAQLEIAIDGVFLPDAEPYYRNRQMTATLTDGSLNIKAKLNMTNGRFTLPGEITLSDIKFGNSRGEFFGVPPQLVERHFREQKRPLVIPFEIKGDINDKTDYRPQVVRILVDTLVRELAAGGMEKALDKLKGKDGTGKGKLKDQIKGLLR